MNIFQLGRVTAVAAAVGLVTVSSGVASAMDRPSSPRSHANSHRGDLRGGGSHSLREAQTHQHSDYSAGARAAKAQAHTAAKALREGVPPDASDAGFTPGTPRDVEQAFHGMANHEAMAVIATQMTAGRAHDVQVLVPLVNEHGQIVYHSTTGDRRFSGLELAGYNAAYAALTPDRQQNLPPAERAQYKTGPQYHLFYKITDISALPPHSPASPVGAQANRSLPTYIQNWITYKPNTLKGKVLEYLYLGAGRGKVEFTVDDLIESGVTSEAQRNTAAIVLIRMEKADYFRLARGGSKGGFGGGGTAATYKPLHAGELNAVSTASRIDRFIRKHGNTVPGKILQYLKDRPGQKFSEGNLIEAGLVPGKKSSNLSDLVSDGLVATEKINITGKGRNPSLYQIPSGS